MHFARVELRDVGDDLGGRLALAGDEGLEAPDEVDVGETTRGKRAVHSSWLLVARASAPSERRRPAARWSRREASDVDWKSTGASRLPPSDARASMAFPDEALMSGSSRAWERRGTILRPKQFGLVGERATDRAATSATARPAAAPPARASRAREEMARRARTPPAGERPARGSPLEEHPGHDGGGNRCSARLRQRGPALRPRRQLDPHRDRAAPITPFDDDGQRITVVHGLRPGRKRAQGVEQHVPRGDSPPPGARDRRGRGR